MSVIELQRTYDISGPLTVPEDSLCQSCKIKGKSFVCLIIKKSQYPLVKSCNEFEPQDDE